MRGISPSKACAATVLCEKGGVLAPSSAIARTVMTVAMLPAIALSSGCQWAFGIDAKELGSNAGASAVDAGVALDGAARTDDASMSTLMPKPQCAEGRAGARNDCGSARDCCEQASLPGGTFYLRTNTIDDVSTSDTSRPTTLSPFALDVFEVTVGRFRAFVEAGGGVYASAPAVGAGAHPSNIESGWRDAFRNYLPRDRAELDDMLLASRFSTWSRVPDGRETLPIASVSYYHAFAFCIWDGGRLPTDAEWAYAAAGGDQQRKYPWGPSVIADAAVWECGEKYGSPLDPSKCSSLDLVPVGSRPKGRARWGHEDLIGSVDEWLLDIFCNARAHEACNDCVTTGACFKRTSRGGDLTLPSQNATTTYDRWQEPVSLNHAKGFRCARAL